MVMAGFDGQAAADRAISKLEDSGFSPHDISVITTEDKSGAEDMANDAAAGAVSGATTGGVIGGLAGLLAGAGVVPALAGFLIGGPVAAALGATGVAATAISGAVTGAAAGGLIGALTSMGVSEESARSYDELVQRGGVILGVTVPEDKKEETRAMFEAAGATRVDDVMAK
jgi:uncharacterized membrane protein